MFEVNTAGSYDLTFAAGGKEETLGGFIDTVSVNVVPAPAAALTLPFAFAAMHLVSRRRRNRA
jgi:hypothetical protein